ncbi:MAG: leucine-rich repeat protein [Bacteroidaceae bacterium]|nr:leucine-rich repeat protein [Bacteroidaceae bacterium]
MKHFLHKISLSLFAAMLTLSSYAQKIEYEGISYILDSDNQTATVTYQGSNPEENNYKGEIEIPGQLYYNDVDYSVTSIGEKAFYGCDSIVYVNIGEFIESIGSEAFANNGMSSLIIPQNDIIISIAEDAFKGSNISLFIYGEVEDFTFLNNVKATTPVFAHDEILETIKEAWPGEPKSIDTPFYLEKLSTMTTIAFRLHKTEFYSLPNAIPFEFSSVIMSAQGSGMTPDSDGVYLCDGLSPGVKRDFVINYNINGNDFGEMLWIETTQPVIECKDTEKTATTFTATIVAQEERLFEATEVGLTINGKKYIADENDKVEVSNLKENTEYTVKPYAVYRGKTYYGSEFTFTTNNSTNIVGVTAGNEPVIVLNNKTRNGYLEVSVNCEGEAAYSIVNITGQKEKEGAISGENKLNNISTDDLSSGIYLININGNNINKTLKFVIK